jgi:integrase
MFAGTRIGEVLAIKWKNIDFENKTMRIERAITQVPKFDNVGNVIDRITVVGDTKTTCSVREIPITDIVVDTLKEWREKQILRQKTSKNVTADLTGPNSFIFANDDGSVRTYSGTRKIFNRFLKRNGLDKCGIHFHGLRHTFSNMLFEMNENPKVIQQLLGHRDVKTTITVYNSVNSDDVREATDKLNTKISQQEQRREERQKEMQEDYEDFDDLTDEELDYEIEELIRQKERREKQKDFEM